MTNYFLSQEGLSKSLIGIVVIGFAVTVEQKIRFKKANGA
jgi:hypothetical protein